MKDIWMEKAREIIAKWNGDGSWKEGEHYQSLGSFIATALEEVAREKDLEVDKAVAIGWKISKQLSEKEAEIVHLKESRSAWAKKSSENADDVSSLSQKLEKAKEKFNDILNQNPREFFATNPPKYLVHKLAEKALKELSEDKK